MKIFSVTIWMLESYILYSCVIIIISTISIITSLLETKKNFERIHTLTIQSAVVPCLQPESSPDFIKIFSHHLKLEHQNYLEQFKRTSSEKLKLGDIVLLEKNMILPCDIILLIGKTEQFR
jgi:magnesium-transporting ATPase (P-type)